MNALMNGFFVPVTADYVTRASGYRILIDNALVRAC
jgi:hypothetical protein